MKKKSSICIRKVLVKYSLLSCELCSEFRVKVLLTHRIVNKIAKIKCVDLGVFSLARWAALGSSGCLAPTEAKSTKGQAFSK